MATDCDSVGGTGRFEGAEGDGTLTTHVRFEGLEDPTWLGMGRKHQLLTD